MTNYLITIFTVLALVSTTIDARNTNSNDDNIMEVSCLGKYTGVFHSYIYIANNNTSTDYYVIRTAWMITYPDRLKSALKEKNLYVMDKNPVDKCGWTLISKIDNYAVSYGNVYRKNNEDKTLETIITSVVYDHYPSLEIFIICLFTVILPVILIVSCILYSELSSKKQYKENHTHEVPLTPPVYSEV
jgi:hypothetical protein